MGTKFDPYHILSQHFIYLLDNAYFCDFDVHIELARP